MLDSMIFSIPSFVAKKIWIHKHPKYGWVGGQQTGSFPVLVGKKRAYNRWWVLVSFYLPGNRTPPPPHSEGPGTPSIRRWRSHILTPPVWRSFLCFSLCLAPQCNNKNSDFARFSLNFLHDFTLFVIDIHQNMSLQSFGTTFEALSKLTFWRLK